MKTKTYRYKGHRITLREDLFVNYSEICKVSEVSYYDWSKTEDGAMTLDFTAHYDEKKAQRQKRATKVIQVPKGGEKSNQDVYGHTHPGSVLAIWVDVSFGIWFKFNILSDVRAIKTTGEPKDGWDTTTPEVGMTEEKEEPILILAQQTVEEVKGLKPKEKNPLVLPRLNRKKRRSDNPSVQMEIPF